jgi:hypothetical protein
MQRPTGVTVLAVLAFIGAAFCLLGALFFMIGGAAMSQLGGSSMGGGAMFAGLGALAGVFILGFAVLYAVVGFGLWKLQNWARILALIGAAVGTLIGLLRILGALAHFHPGIVVLNLIVCAFDIWILTYLLKPHVKQAFGA